MGAENERVCFLFRKFSTSSVTWQCQSSGGFRPFSRKCLILAAAFPRNEGDGQQSEFLTRRLTVAEVVATEAKMT